MSGEWASFNPAEQSHELGDERPVPIRDVLHRKWPTLLLSVDETIDALRTAEQVKYRPPGG